MKTTINAALVFTMHLLATAWAGAAQQGGQVHQIGMLISGFVATHGQRMEFFRQGLRQLGYVEGKNGGLKPDAIFVASAGLTRAVKEATNTIPIVAIAGDLV
jgi:hypothetical protein